MRSLGEMGLVIHTGVHMTVGRRKDGGARMELPFGTYEDVGLEVYREYVRQHQVIGRPQCAFSRALERMMDGGRCFEGWRKAKFYW